MKKLFAVLGLICFCHAFSYAQEPLTLSEAIARALSQNFDIRIQQQNIAIAQLNNTQGQAGRYPTISLNLNQNNVLNNIINPAAFIQGDIRNFSIQPAANVNWVIFDGFRINLTKQRLEELEKLSQGNARIVIENTIQAVILAYYDAVRLQERIKISEKVLKTSRDIYEYTLLKQEVGKAVVTEVLLEKNNYLADSSALLTQQVQFKNAIRNLNVLMAVADINKTYLLTDSLVFDDAEYSYEALREKMFSSNSNLEAQLRNQELLHNSVGLAKANLLPNLSLFAGFTYNRNRQNLEAAKFIDGRQRPNNTASTRTLNGGFTFTMPIFNGGQLRRAVEAAQMQEQAGQFAVDNLKLSLERDLADAYDLYNLRRQQVKIARENKIAAETNLNLAAERYRNGSINAFEYRILQNTFADIAFGEIQAIFNLQEAKTLLMRLTGTILTEK
ncbi:MAG: TolC family protein [Cytophagales bacterium]|nr:TolC family protein [Bernardetiaceae bacterium]MDW8205471.1 TolC family protein [Cytophagales bacterium]